MMATLPLIAGLDLRDTVPSILAQLPAGQAAVVLLIAWLGVLGAVIGSFLNVVVYRMPLGMSVSFPGSRCPVCKHAIRWYDNVPVLGWLWLGGRCRDCRTAISPRYPLVELAVGLMFAGLVWLELFQDGLNLPAQPESAAGATDGLPAWFPWLRYAYHLLFACTALCIGLIDHDRRRVPVRFWGAVLLLGLALPLAWPELRPVAAFDAVSITPADQAWMRGLVDGLAGMALGGSLGWLLSLPGKHASSPGISTTIVVLDLTGAFLGWQAVAWAFAGGLLLLGGSRLAPRHASRHVEFPLCASVAAIGLLFCWRWLSNLQESWHLPAWSAVGALAILAFVASRFRNRDASQEGKVR